MSSLLSLNSTSAERFRRCSFAERFRNAQAIVENNGTIVGNPTFDRDGVILDGTNDAVRYTLGGGEFNNSLISYVQEFWPTTEPDDGIKFVWFDTTGGDYTIFKNTLNQIRVYTGDGTLVILAAINTFDYLWRVGERNVLQYFSDGTDNSLYLNGILVAAASVGWTPSAPSVLYVGESAAGADRFNGKIGEVKIFKSLLDANDASNYYLRKMYSYRDSAILDLPMRAANHDPDNVRTLDISGGKFSRNNNHATLSGPPTKRQNRGYVFNGSSEFLTLPVAAFPGESGSIFLCLSNISSTSTRIVGTGHSSGSNYEMRTNLAGGKLTIYFPITTGLRDLAPDAPMPTGPLFTYGFTWERSGSDNIYTVYQDGIGHSETHTENAIPSPDGSFLLMRWASGFATGNIHQGFLSDEPMSSIQAADLHLQMLERADWV